jgi:hypothetical protein
MRQHHVFLARVFLFSFVLLTVARAEIPLPDTVVYGTIERNGQVVEGVTIVGRVRRNDPGSLNDCAEPLLEFSGEIVVHQDAGRATPYYVLRVPLETDIRAPGPSCTAAREGDVLEAILVNGEVFPIPNIELQAGKVQKLLVSHVPR